MPNKKSDKIEMTKETIEAEAEPREPEGTWTDSTLGYCSTITRIPRSDDDKVERLVSGKEIGEKCCVVNYDDYNEMDEIINIMNDEDDEYFYVVESNVFYLDVDEAWHDLNRIQSILDETTINLWKQY